ncbi:MlaD family protein [Neorickettsia sennetsu]|uniref:Mce-related protein n=1 Tax=Ehrlichia sennetsu (strain ATCC VR-367 / Miyayama) TaxID=222891 RepID=Q2GDN5_EHRS3|nr:MlaD family protein [Neorickettsia sennetsu]ABD45614.1 mce-related protein [Neorickettsia sennetsu str. Miyayama]
MDVRLFSGTLVLLVSALIFVFLSSNFSLLKRGGCYELNAIFDDALGLSIGSDVLLSGVKAGRITKLSIGESFRVHVRMCIDEGVRLPRDSVAVISAGNIFSTTKNINIDPGISSEILPPGGTFETTRSALDMEKILRSIIKLKLR